MAPASHRLSGPKVTLRDLIAANVIRAPLELHKEYHGHRFTACVERDGTVTVLGARYKSLSTAAGAVRAHARQLRHFPATNGWDFWTFQDETGQSHPVSLLRRRFQES